MGIASVSSQFTCGKAKETGTDKMAKPPQAAIIAIFTLGALAQG